MTKKAKAAQQAEQQTQTNGDTAGTNQDAQGATQTTEGGQTPTEQQQTDPAASGADQTGEGSASDETSTGSQDTNVSTAAAEDVTGTTLLDQGLKVLDDAFAEKQGDSDIEDTKEQNPTDLNAEELGVLNRVADSLAQVEEQAAEPYVYEGVAPTTPHDSVPSHEHHFLNAVDAVLGFPPDVAYEKLEAMDTSAWPAPCRDYHAAIVQYVHQQE